MKINPAKRAQLLALGVEVPLPTNQSMDVKKYFDWDDLDGFEGPCECPYCKRLFQIDERVKEHLDCPKCGKAIEIVFGEIEVTAYISVEPRLSPADEKYLAWKAGEKAA